MKIQFRQLVAGAALAALSTSSFAIMATFDDGSGLGSDRPSTVGGSLGFTGFEVFGSYSTFNLCCGGTFSRGSTGINDAIAYQDVAPENGGLGVVSGLDPQDSDNLEGSLNGDPNSDEILFFDFASTVFLNKVFFNAGPGSRHAESFADDEMDVFNIFFSSDGTNYTSIFGDHQRPTDGEYLDVDGPSGMYFAVAHGGPTAENGAVGGYIEAIKYSSVPEPGTLALLGLGLAGLGLSRRRKQA